MPANLVLFALCLSGSRLSPGQVSCGDETAITLTTSQLVLANRYWIGDGEVKRDRVKAAALYLLAAEAGDAEAMARIGRMYTRGEGIPKDPKLAMHWLNSSAGKGNARGTYHLAEIYQIGFGVPIDFARYALLLKDAAARGSADATFEMGQCFEYGVGVPRDLSTAKTWYQKASTFPEEAFYPETLSWMFARGDGFKKSPERALQFSRKVWTEGYVSGSYLLARHYLYGIGIPQDVHAAFEWLTKEESFLYPPAMVELGQLLTQGKVAPKDMEQASLLFRIAARGGSAEGMYLVGLCHEQGIGVQVNRQAAFQCFTKAANLGYYPAYFNIATAYHIGSGVEKDSVKAFGWMTRGAEHGHLWATLGRGLFLFQGIGCEPNPDLAFKTFQELSDRGFEKAFGMLGLCHLNGVGTKKDPQSALTWFRRGAEAGQPECQWSLGEFYLEGNVVAEDPAESYRWHQKSAEQGFGGAIHRLGWFNQTGIHVPKNLPAAMDYFRKAGERGNAGSWLSLGSIYESGEESVPVDLQKARLAFLRGAELGDTGCMERTGRCLEFGLGGSIDIDQALTWYKKAMERGDAKAREAYERLASPLPQVESVEVD